MFNSNITPIIPQKKKLFSTPLQNIKRTIYLVDDDHDDCKFGTICLQQSNRLATIKSVNSASELFDCFNQQGLYKDISFNDDNSPIILLDIHMPTTNGIEVLERIRNHPITSDFPVILLTSNITCETIYDAYRLQANGYLQKPFKLNDFHEIMDRIQDGSSKVEFINKTKH